MNQEFFTGIGQNQVQAGTSTMIDNIEKMLRDRLEEEFNKLLQGNFIMPRDLRNRLWQTIGDSPTALRYYEFLWDRCFNKDDNEGATWYSQEKICNYLQIKARTYRDICERLEKNHLALRLTLCDSKGVPGGHITLVNLSYPSIPSWFPSKEELENADRKKYYPAAVTQLLKTMKDFTITRITETDLIIRLHPANNIYIRVLKSDFEQAVESGVLTVEEFENEGLERHSNAEPISPALQCRTNGITMPDQRHSNAEPTNQPIPFTSSTEIAFPHEGMKQNKNESNKNEKEKNNSKKKIVVVISEPIKQFCSDRNIKVTDKTISDWLKLADETTVLQVLSATVSKSGVENVVGYVTSSLKNGFVPTSGIGSKPLLVDELPASVKWQMEQKKKNANQPKETNSAKKAVDDPELKALIDDLKARVRKSNDSNIGTKKVNSSNEDKVLRPFSLDLLAEE